jgi:V/A-type H+-transporting ATPase subunit E
MSQHTEKLEGLISAQAMNLAQQHMEKGHEASDQIRRELQAKLRQLEEGEEQRFQIEADQLCKQLMQAARIRTDTELDRLRWALVQEVLGEVRTRLEKLAEDPERYFKVLERYVAEAASSLPEGDLVAEMNPRDLHAVRENWERLAERAAPGRKLRLAALSEQASGGVMVRTEEGKLRVDNTFEGRLGRMHDQIMSVIMEKLFKDTDQAS